ncbi:MAG: hypothetical protein ABIO70_06540 [Pseudomonadota bacterium]
MAAVDPSGYSFARYLDPGAPTVTIHVAINGVEAGQIDFTAFEGDALGEGRAEAIHIQHFATSTFDVTAPADFGRKLFVSACTLDEEGRPNPDGAKASAKAPLVLGSEDVSITLEPDSSHPMQPQPPFQAVGPDPAEGAPSSEGALPAAEAPPAGEAPATP